eukprot:scaffold743_cov117-Cylindrotheca_fusiformis.AAC.24
MVKQSNDVPGNTNVDADAGHKTLEKNSQPSHHRRTVSHSAACMEKQNKTSRHRKSIASFLPATPEKKKSPSNHVRGEKTRTRSTGHRRSRSLPPQAGSAHKPHDRSMHSLDVLDQPERSVGKGTTFYVRVSLASLSGIKVCRNARRKRKSTDNFQISGYASLAKTGNQIAISRPISPDFGEPHSKSSKIIWVASCGNEKNKCGKHLHFLLQLHRDCLVDDNARDDNSVNSQCSFQPKVVKIVVGLKCGDEKLPLGIANLVVNGMTGSGTMLDLAMHPVENDSSDKALRQNKQRLSLFGSKKQGVSFSDDCWYSLSSNATLRLSIDTTTFSVGKASRESLGEQISSSTENAQNQETRIGPEESTKPPRIQEQSQREPDRTPEEFRFPSIPSQPKTGSKNMSVSSAPLEYVTVTTTEGMSVASDISSRRSVLYGTPCEMTSEMMNSCLGLCGNTDTVAESDEIKLTNVGDETKEDTQRIEDFKKPAEGGLQGAPPVCIAEDSHEDVKNSQQTLRR